MERIEFVAPLQVRWRVAEEPTPHGAGLRPRVYLDTSIPSYLVGRLNPNREIERRQRITDTWWRRHRHHSAIFISDEVKEEAKAGNEELAAQRLTLLEGIESLHPSSRSEEIASALIELGALPPKAKIDAKHIAIAAAHSMHYLLTWNCRHMANPFNAHRIVQTCEMLGFRSPKICTPEVLMRIYRHERPNP